jgi:hypothetical protein
MTDVSKVLTASMMRVMAGAVCTSEVSVSVYRAVRPTHSTFILAIVTASNLTEVKGLYNISFVFFRAIRKFRRLLNRNLFRIFGQIFTDSSLKQGKKNRGRRKQRTQLHYMIHLISLLGIRSAGNLICENEHVNV